MYRPVLPHQDKLDGFIMLTTHDHFLQQPSSKVQTAGIV